MSEDPGSKRARDLPVDVLNILCSLGSSHYYEKGYRVYAEDEHIIQVHILEEGEIGLFVSDSEGKEVCVGVRKPPWILGAACLFPQRPSPASARALSSSKLRQIPAPTFLRALEENPKLSSWMIETLAGELYDQIAAHSLVVLQDISNRLQYFIWQLTESCPAGRCKVQWPFSQKDVARYLGTTETYLSSLLTQLVKRGLIMREDGWIIVPDRTKLWRKISAKDR